MRCVAVGVRPFFFARLKGREVGKTFGGDQTLEGRQPLWFARAVPTANTGTSVRTVLGGLGLNSPLQCVTGLGMPLNPAQLNKFCQERSGEAGQEPAAGNLHILGTS